MTTSSEAPRTNLYLLLLAIQIVGSIVFVWQQLPEFRHVVLNPGMQLPPDASSDFMTFIILSVMQVSFWYRLRNISIPFRRPNMVLHHALLFLGRISFIFGSALFSVCRLQTSAGAWSPDRRRAGDPPRSSVGGMPVGAVLHQPRS